MLALVPEEIEEYIKAHSAKESPLLLELVNETKEKTDLPQMQIGQIEGAFLKLLVILLKAKRILEIGTFTGYSALVMAEGLPPDGELITLDKNTSYTDIAQKFWARSPHGKKIKLVLGDAIQSIQLLEGQFDLVFIDAHKPDYIQYWDLSMPMVRRGGLIVADNVLWSGRVLNPQKEDDFGIDSFNKFVSYDTRVEAIMLSIRDGLTVARKL
ncbi:MAG: methyltransferase [Candidatus Melainabacteria bacterium RIFCSPHIGHO2_02_FULL_34_12]|nr:MAG: methyltransferase [Candidatus Melainabacteria bacterium RIFCSPHIGHO2_02_FULL_34_12]